MLMRFLQATAATTLFEFKQSITGKKLSAAGVLVLFPPLILFILLRLSDEVFLQAPELLLSVLLWMIGLLALLLWLPSNIATELEGQTWIFATSRPYGRATMILGKYFSAVAWTLLIETIAFLLAVVAVWSRIDMTVYATGLAPIILLAALAYGAVFSLIGVLALRKAMGFAVGYCLVSEVLIATVPALVQNFTVRSHLQALGFHWVSDFELLEKSRDLQQLLQATEPLPIWGNVASLLAMAIALLTIAIAIANYRQYLTQAEA